MFDIKYELSRLPDLPGIYLMKDQEDEIIYVGKAKNLRNRVRSYFSGDSGKSLKVIKMVEKIESFEYIIVENEVEALVLESNFIKEHRPHYNILLRDDKQYPYIQLTNEKFPRINKVRQAKQDGHQYFGPYPNGYAVHEIISLLQSTFKIRTCNLNFDKGARLKRPCLNYYIGKCDAPCVDKADEEVYMENVAQVIDFLKGNEKPLVKIIEGQMQEEAKKLNFERAAEFRDYLSFIEAMMERQKVSDVRGENIDIIAMDKKDTFVCIQIYFMRDGKIVDREHFILDNLFDEENNDVISAFMTQFYSDTSFIPKEIIVQYEPSDVQTIEGMLYQITKRKTHIHQPKRGKKVDLVTMAAKNAKEMLDEFLLRREKRERNKNLGLKQLEKTLNLKSIDRIEAYDISNISGVHSVGSMVVYEAGKKAKKEYRKFRIKSVSGPDDYASLEEVLIRRFKRAKKAESSETGFGKLPDLVIIDGGIGHTNIAKAAMGSVGYAIPTIGLAKDEKHKTRAIILDGQEIELDKQSAIYRFLYGIQEEVHRFAIGYHQQLRSKAMTQSELNEIPGLGKKRIENLFKHFKTLSAIKEASVDQLLKVESINKTVAQNIYDYFRGH